MTAWGRMFISALNGFAETRETALVRMFRVEYSKEYQFLRRNGCPVTDDFVRDFLGVK